MRVYFIFFAVLVLSFTESFAQSYKWIAGGGSAFPMTYARDWPRVTSMCTDDAKNVYITSPVGDVDIQAGTFFMSQAFYCCSGQPHTLVASYNCAGNFRWAKVIESTDFATNNGIVYSNGYVYLAETMGGSNVHIGYDTTFATPPGGYCISSVIKLDTLGNFKWLRSTGIEDQGGYAINGGAITIAVDGHGNIHHYDYVPDGIAISASITSILGTYDLKYNPAGNLLSAVRMQIDTLGGMYSTESSLLDYPVINKASGVVYATVYFTDTTGGLDYGANNLAAYDTLGHRIWYDTSRWPNSFTGLAYDGNNNLYTIGYGQLDSDHFQAYFPIHGDTIRGNGYPILDLSTILILDTFGNLKRHYDVSFNENGGFQNICIVPGGKLALTGTMVYAAKYGTDSLVNTTGSQEPFKAVFDTAGHLMYWAYDTGTGFYNWGTALAADNIGDVYFAGMNSQQLTVPGLAPIASVGGSSSFYVTKYGYSCSCTVVPVASFTYTGTSTVSLTYTGTTGYDSLKWSFGDNTTSTAINPTHTYSTTGTHNICVTVYTSCGSDTYCKSVSTTGVGNVMMNGVSIYPNPMSAQLIIERAETGITACLLNVLGQAVYTGTVNSDKYIIDTKQLPQGAYVLLLTDNKGNRWSQTILKW